MNKKIKVTDLEKFVLEQVFRPYQGHLLGHDAPQLERLTKEYNLDIVMYLLDIAPTWAALTMKRIIEIGFEFPEYINHPLVSLIKELQDAEKDN